MQTRGRLIALFCLASVAIVWLVGREDGSTMVAGLFVVLMVAFAKAAD